MGRANLVVEIGHILVEPPSLALHRASNPAGLWDHFPGAPEKQELRHQLNLEQGGLCIYCESELGLDAHSCDGPGRCGHHKRREVLPIEPRPNANNFFALSELTGELSPVVGLSALNHQRAKDTLRILGLNNDPGLNRSRQQYAFTLHALLTAADIAAFLSYVPFRWSLKCL